MAEVSIKLWQHIGTHTPDARVTIEPRPESSTVWLTLHTDDGRHDATLLPDEARAVAATLIATATEAEQ